MRNYVLPIAILAASLPDSASAFVPYERVPRPQMFSENGLAIPKEGQKRIRPAGSESFLESGELGTGVVTYNDDVTGKPLLVSGVLRLDLNALLDGGLASWNDVASSAAGRLQMAVEVEKHARQFLKENISTLAVDESLLQLNAGKFYSDASNTFLSFDVTVHGVKVDGAEVAFRFSKGKLVQLLARTFGATSESVAAFGENGTRELQLATARAVLGSDAKLEGNATPLIYVTKSEGRYVFNRALEFEALDSKKMPYIIVRSLDKTEVLEWRTRFLPYKTHVKGEVNLRTVGGDKKVIGFPFIRIKFGDKTLDTDELGSYEFEEEPLEALKAEFVSARYLVKDESRLGRDRPGFLANSEELIFNDDNSNLAERSTFYHLNVVQNWARPIINPDWFSTQVRANVNINEACNAYWDRKTLNFFRAGKEYSSSGQVYDCNNTGEIADVVYHEWGHGLDQATGGIDDYPFSEGIGDVTSMLITGSPLVGPTFFKDGKPVRDLDGEYKYPPSDDEYDSHKEGLIIGAAWFHLYEDMVKELGEEKAKELGRLWFLKSLYTASEYTDVYEAVLAIQADGGHPNEGAHFCLINKAFTRHGLAKKASRCNE